MEYKYFTSGREPEVGKKIQVNERPAIVRFVSVEKKPINDFLISKQRELMRDAGFLAVRVGFEFID